MLVISLTQRWLVTNYEDGTPTDVQTGHTRLSMFKKTLLQAINSTGAFTLVIYVTQTGTEVTGYFSLDCSHLEF